MITKINKSEFNEKVLNSTGKCIVDFSATWCGPCRMLAPVLEELSEEYSDISFYNIDVDDEPELSAEFGVMSVPTVYIFENGQEKTHFIGLQPKEKISEIIG